MDHRGAHPRPPFFDRGPGSTARAAGERRGTRGAPAHRSRCTRRSPSPNGPSPPGSPGSTPPRIQRSDLTEVDQVTADRLLGVTGAPLDLGELQPPQIQLHHPRLVRHPRPDVADLTARWHRHHVPARRQSASPSPSTTRQIGQILDRQQRSLHLSLASQTGQTLPRIAANPFPQHSRSSTPANSKATCTLRQAMIGLPGGSSEATAK